MLSVVRVSPGVIELNYMWLPTVIGMNTVLKAQMEKDLEKTFVGLPTDDESLYQVHQHVVKYLCEQFPHVKGLDRYLDAMKYLEP